MKLADTKYDNSETDCCARLDVERWDGREFHWDQKPFLRDHIRSFLHIPLNYGSVISRDHAAVEGASAYPEEPLWLTDELSPWGSDIYLAIEREIPDVEIERLSGTFFTKVFEGPYRHAGKWAEEMERYIADRGGVADHIYFYYATCPKCAKLLGKNQVVLFAHLKETA